MQPAVFLDRDNTLIANDGDLGDPDEVRLCEGVAQGLLLLHEAGYRLIVVTNQGGVARGRYTETDVDSVHQRIACLIDEQADGSHLIDRFYYCPFHPDAELEEYRRDHPWRKPHPGMILQAAHDLQLDLSRSWMIGDQVRDIQSGHAAGCRTALINDDWDMVGEAKPTVNARTFLEVVEGMLKYVSAPVPVVKQPVEIEANGPRATEREPDSTSSDESSRASSSGNGQTNKISNGIATLLEKLEELPAPSPRIAPERDHERNLESEPEHERTQAHEETEYLEAEVIEAEFIEAEIIEAEAPAPQPSPKPNAKRAQKRSAKRAAKARVKTAELVLAEATRASSPKPSPAPGHKPASPATDSGKKASPEADLSSLHRVLGELTEELRSERMRKAEFTMLKMGAGICQLLVVLLAMLGLLQVGQTDVFMKWMIGAVLCQLVTFTLLSLDNRG